METRETSVRGEPDGVETVIQHYRAGSIPVGRAVELADVPVWRFIEILGERGVEVNYDENDLESDLRAVQAGEALAE